MTTDTTARAYLVTWTATIDFGVQADGRAIELATDETAAHLAVTARMPHARILHVIDVQAEYETFLHWCGTGEDPAAIARGLIVCAGERGGLFDALAEHVEEENAEAAAGARAEASYLAGR